MGALDLFIHNLPVPLIVAKLWEGLDGPLSLFGAVALKVVLAVFCLAWWERDGTPQRALATGSSVFSERKMGWRPAVNIGRLQSRVQLVLSSSLSTPSKGLMVSRGG